MELGDIRRRQSRFYRCAAAAVAVPFYATSDAPAIKFRIIRAAGCRRPTDRDLSCVWCAIGRTGWPPTDKPPAGPGRAARTDERHVPCNSPPVRYLTSVGSRRCRQCDGRPTSVHEGIAPTSQEVRKILVAASYLSICYCSVLSTHSSTLWRRLKLSNCSMV